MTPPAATAAGRRPEARSTSRRTASPRAPRRVSGPLGGRGAVVAPRLRPSALPRSTGHPLTHRAAARIRALPDHAVLDRLTRGRFWIPLLGVMLAGIVAMQVEVLKLGSSMGRWVERSSALTSRNEQLRASVATLADDQRIESLAAAMGMVMPPPTELGFVAAGSADPRSAIAGIHTPDPAAFLAALPAQSPATSSYGAVAASSATVTPTTSTGMSTTTASPTSTTSTTPTTSPTSTSTGTSTSGGAGAAGTASSGQGTASPSQGAAAGGGGTAPTVAATPVAPAAPTGAAGLPSGPSGN